MSATIAIGATVVLPLFAFGMTCFNALAWPRAARVPGLIGPKISVLIPARNEERSIREAVQSALAQPVDEVIVYDDDSEDATRSIVEELAHVERHIKLLEHQPLPAGWVGKPHACHNLGEAASGAVLLFLDADVVLAADATRRIAELLERYRADAVTLVPRQRAVGVVEKLALPMLHVTYLSWLPTPLVWYSTDPRFLAANGQLLAVSAEAYRSVGGFAAVCDAVVDDMAFCRALKRVGRRVVFADGDAVAMCRMYSTPGEVWRGFSKNIREGIGSTAGVFGVIALYLATFVLPWFTWLLGANDPRWYAASGVGIGATVAQRAIVAVRHHYPAWTVFAVVPSTLLFVAIALNSVRWHHRDAIVWAGRTYARRERRDG